MKHWVEWKMRATGCHGMRSAECGTFGTCTETKGVENEKCVYNVGVRKNNQCIKKCRVLS